MASTPGDTGHGPGCGDRADPLDGGDDAIDEVAALGGVDAVAATLAAERATTVRRLTGLGETFGDVVAASRDANGDDEHDPEGTTIAFERSQVGALLRRVRGHLEEVDAAADRLASGTYGTCQRCGGRIGVDRLGARPVARTCLSCAR